MGIGRFLGRFDLVGIIDTILVALGRLRCIQASLDVIDQFSILRVDSQSRNTNLN